LVIGTPWDQFHDEVGPAVLGCAAIEDAGDVNMIHHGQGLPLGLEAGDNLARVHAGLDHFEGDLPLDRVRLLGHPDHTHAAFADLLQELVRTNNGTRALANGLLLRRSGELGYGRPIEKAACRGIMLQQFFDLGAKLLILSAGSVQVGGALGWAREFRGCVEDLADFVVFTVHHRSPHRLRMRQKGPSGINLFGKSRGPARTARHAGARDMWRIKACFPARRLC
jgi:hypothetical protein